MTVPDEVIPAMAEHSSPPKRRDLTERGHDTNGLTYSSVSGCGEAGDAEEMASRVYASGMVRQARSADRLS